MGFVTEFVRQPLVAALIDRYREALRGDGDTGAARGAVMQQLLDMHNEERAELRDLLDSIAEAPGAPKGLAGHSNFGIRMRGKGHHER